MSNLPRHVGRDVGAETGYALVCNAVSKDGDPWSDALCGRRATHHARWEEATTENGMACAEHLSFALSFDPYDVHSVEDSACGMPGAFWVPGDPSHCAMPLLDEEPEMTGAVLIAAAS